MSAHGRPRTNRVRHTHPYPKMAIVKAALTSCTMMAVGDVIAQNVSNQPEWDKKRTGRYALVGLLLHGPYFYVMYGLIDKLGGRDPRQWLRKTLVSHVSVFPIYITCFLSCLTAIERIPMIQSNATQTIPLMEAMQQRVKTMAWPIFRDGTAFWPMVNFVTFKLLPQGPGSQVVKVAWANVAGIAWQSYLSAKTSVKVPLEAD